MDILKAKIESTEINDLNKLVNVQIAGLPFSIASVWLKAGSRNDPEGKEGLAHFFEHLLMTKTIDYPDRISRLKHMASLGMDFNAFTSHEHANYHLTTSPENINKAMNLLVDGLHNSIITSEDTEHEKNIILDEESRNRNNPSDYLWRLRQKSLWPDGPLGKDFFGNESTISSITLDDVLAFKKNFYDQGEKVWIIIGDHSRSAVEEKIRSFLVDETVPQQPKDKYVTESVLLSEPRNTFHKDKSEDIAVGVYYRTTSISNEKDVIRLNLLRELLSDNWTSRLTERMRIKENITYWVNGQTDNFSDNGFVGFTFSTKKELVGKSLNIIEEEIASLQKGDISDELIRQTKEVYISRLIQNHLTPNSLLWWYGPPAISNVSILDLSTYVTEVNNVTKEDLQEMASKYLIAKNRSIVTIGDIEEKGIIW